MAGLRIHRLSKEDIKRVAAFANAAEAMLEKDKFSLKSAYDQWEEWDDDDEDKLLIYSIRKSLIRDEEMDEDRIDGRIVAYEYLRRKYTHMLDLVLLTTDVLIDNCCDPMESTLEFHPSIYEMHVAPEQ